MITTYLLTAPQSRASEGTIASVICSHSSPDQNSFIINICFPYTIIIIRRIYRNKSLRSIIILLFIILEIIYILRYFVKND